MLNNWSSERMEKEREQEWHMWTVVEAESWVLGVHYVILFTVNA